MSLLARFLSVRTRWQRCAERVTVWFGEAGGVAGKNDRMGARSEVVTKTCNVGTDSALKAHMEDIGERIVDVPVSEKVQECVEATTDCEAHRRLSRAPCSFSRRASRRTSSNRMSTCQRLLSRALRGSEVDTT